ncbi:hypothetical protein ABW21_db0202261 [Orbilia brochopaga]|nr:hypothetical protein ABW21_db0202261 [Drechslerella brochopaga]
MSKYDQEQDAKRAELLETFSEDMRRVFNSDMLLKIGASFVTRAPSDPGVITYFEHMLKHKTCPPHTTWLQRYHLLSEFGVTDEKIKDLRRLQKEWQTVFHISDDSEGHYLSHYTIQMQLLDIAWGAMRRDFSTIFDSEPVTDKHFYNESAAKFQPTSPPRVIRREMTPRHGRTQALTPEKELWFPTAFEFRSWIEALPAGHPGFGDETFFPADNLGSNAYLRKAGSTIERATMYHGLNLGRYKGMLSSRGFNRHLSSIRGDLAPEPALYFSNDAVYALAWSVLKATSYCHLNTPFHKLTGIVIVVPFNPKAETSDGILTLRPELAEEYMYKASKIPRSEDSDEEEDESLWDGWTGIQIGKMIMGPFCEHHLAELEGVTSKKSLGTIGRRERQWTSRAYEYLENIDDLRQIAVLGPHGEKWLDGTDFKVCFVSMGWKQERGQSMKAYSTEEPVEEPLEEQAKQAEPSTPILRPTFFDL